MTASCVVTTGVNMKLVIFMRTDLNMSRGKMAVQAGHAVAHTMMNSHPDDIETWFENAQVKIVLPVNSLKEMTELRDKADARGLPYHVVHDAGRTEVEPDTATCLAIGIAKAKRIDKLTSGYKPLK